LAQVKVWAGEGEEDEGRHWEVINEGRMVTIRRQWNDWKVAQAKISSLSRFHWSDFSGGVGQPTPQYFIHAYVDCDVVVGDISHSCLHGRGPHSIKVVILKKDNDREVINHILRIVGPKPEKKGRGATK
jgi:hypothetical protein